MNKCDSCGTLYPEYYDKCPSCKTIEHSKYERIIKIHTEQNDTIGNTYADNFVTHSECGIFYSKE